MAIGDFGRRYEKNDSNSADYTKKLTLNQYFLLISQYRLTELLETLEKRGLTGDVAIFILANLQDLEVGS